VATTATSVLFNLTFAGNLQLAVELPVSHVVSCTNPIWLLTVRLTVVVCVTPPPLAVIVIVYVPVAVVEATAKVAVELPVPGAAIGLGLKLTVTPLGCPLADSDTEPLNPFRAVVVTVVVPLLPCTTLNDPGEVVKLKSATAWALTVRLIAVVCVTPPPLAVIVIVYVPVAVVEATARVAVELPVPGAAIGLGLKLTVTPLGCPLADSDTEPLNPFRAVVVTVVVPLLPCTTLNDPGEVVKLKSATDEVAG